MPYCECCGKPISDAQADYNNDRCCKCSDLRVKE